MISDNILLRELKSWCREPLKKKSQGDLKCNTMTSQDMCQVNMCKQHNMGKYTGRSGTHN